MSVENTEKQTALSIITLKPVQSCGPNIIMGLIINQKSHRKVICVTSTGSKCVMTASWHPGYLDVTQ